MASAQWQRYCLWTPKNAAPFCKRQHELGQQTYQQKTGLPLVLSAIMNGNGDIDDIPFFCARIPHSSAFGNNLYSVDVNIRSAGSG